MHLGTEVAARSHQNTIASCSNASSSSTETIRQCDGKPTPRSLCDRTTGRLAFEPQVFETPILATASTAVNKSIYSRHLAYTFQTLHCKLDLISPTWFNAMPQATEKNLITGSTAPQYFAHLAPPHRRSPSNTLMHSAVGQGIIVEIFSLVLSPGSRFSRCAAFLPLSNK